MTSIIDMNEKALPLAERKYSLDEYSRLEKKDGIKHEYYNGKVLTKSGSGRRHNLICSNMTIAVGSRVIGQKFEVYVNDMRVKLASNAFCYPDLVVAGGNPEFDERELDVLLNPIVIVEVVSQSTFTHDRTQKLEGYLAMESIKECLLVKEEEMRVEHYAKQAPKHWSYKIYDSRDDIISLDSVNCKISLSEIYAQIKFSN